MPHIPDLRSHADHDLELVAAYAAGDAVGADLETATALVAGCAACAELHHDLRAIAAAMPELPAPVRPRDFRLTAGQAAALRPGGWRGALAAFAGPRFRLAGPVGAGLATLGIAGILLGSIASVPLGAGGAATALDQRESGGQPSSAGGAPLVEPSAAPTMAAAGPIRTVGGTPVPGASGSSDYGAASQGVDVAGGAGAAASPAGPPAELVPQPVTSATGPVADRPGAKTSTAAPLGTGGLPAGEVLAIAGAVALLAGVCLLGLRWTSRRVG